MESDRFDGPEPRVRPPGSDGLTVIKFGGVLITRKDAYKALDEARIAAFGEDLAVLVRDGCLDPRSTVIVLGGGSFGNAVPRRYNLFPRGRDTRPEDISRMSLSQIELASHVIDAWRRHGVGTQFLHLPSLSTTEVDADGLCGLNMAPVAASLSAGLMPVVTGDLIVSRDGNTAIVSSDLVPLAMARSAALKRVIYLTNTPGVLRAPDDEASTIAEISLDATGPVEDMTWSSGPSDLTGGMALKLRTCLDLARLGIDSSIIDGRRPLSLLSLLKHGRAFGTVCLGAMRKAAVAADVVCEVQRLP